MVGIQKDNDTCHLFAVQLSSQRRHYWPVPFYKYVSVGSGMLPILPSSSNLFYTDLWAAEFDVEPAVASELISYPNLVFGLGKQQYWHARPKVADILTRTRLDNPGADVSQVWPPTSHAVFPPHGKKPSDPKRSGMQLLIGDSSLRG